MQEDKQLKALLTKWAVEQPAADFTNTVMQRITSAGNAHTSPLHQQKLPRLLPGAFIIICVLLLALSFRVPAATIAFLFTPKLPAQYLMQGFYFLVAFWVVMLLNLLFKKYFFHRSTQNHSSF